MGIPKKGSRKITVDGENFIWLIRRQPYIDYLNVAVEHAEGTGSKLIIIADRLVIKDCNLIQVKPVVPSEVTLWIHKAIKAGWEPKKPGKPFEFLVSI